MKSNKIAIRLLLSITIIFAGLILLLGAKKEVHLYNFEEYDLSAGRGAITFLATYDECATHNSIPQPTALKNLGLSVFCVERGGRLGKYGIPDSLSDLTSVGDQKWINDLSKEKTYLYELKGIDRGWKARRTSYKYTYDPSNLTKFKDLRSTKTDYDTEYCGPEVAYIASCSPNSASGGDNWTPEKQVAIWLSGIGNVTNSGNAEDTDGSIFDSTSYPRQVVMNGIQIYAQARQYQTFINSGRHFRDNTNYNTIETEKIGDSYIIGPFNITYNGTYTPTAACMSDEFWNTWSSGHNPDMCIGFNTVTFGGVTDFKLMLDLNGDGVCETSAPIRGYGYTKNNTNNQFNLYYTNNGVASINYGDKYVYNSLYYDGVYTDDSSGYKSPVNENGIPLDFIEFPDSGQNFYIKIDANLIEGATSAKISGQYDWMNYDEDEGVTVLTGSGKQVIVRDVRNETGNKYDAKVELQAWPSIQDLVAIKATRFIETIPFESSSTFEIRPPVMNIDGYVWNDLAEGKESETDGLYRSGTYDKAMGNVKVTLYYIDEETNNITMVPQSDFNPSGTTNIMYRINPTITSNDGYYMFAGLDTSKKYFVEFEYNGQKYIPTDHNKTITGTPTPITNSQAVELGNVRTTLDNRFQEIKSSPKSYTSKNNCGFNITDNITFTQLELMGYKLIYDTTTNRYKYVQEANKQLIDGYLFNEIGQQTSTYSQGIITTKIKAFISNNNRYPTNSEMNTIYSGIVSQIAGSDNALAQEIKQKIQFIEDCKIKATTAQKVSGSFVRRNYSITDAVYDSSEHIEVIHNVSLGLYDRQEFDLHLWSDANVINVSVNGMNEKYFYNSGRNPVFTQNTASYTDREHNVTYAAGKAYGNMYARLSLEKGNTSKYNTRYMRKIYNADFNVDSYNDRIENVPQNDPKDNGIEVEIRYGIIIYNESLSVKGKVMEVVDNYLNTLEYVTGSVEAYIGGTKINTVYTNLDKQATDPSEPDTIYDGTEEPITGFNRLYIRGLDDVQIGSNQSITISITFKAKTTDGHLDSDLTRNIAEINGFKTYYLQGTKLPNDVVINNSNTIAGLIDRDSLPGNLQDSHLQGEHYEVNIQDDTDISHTINLKDEGEREINGTVWEDKRNVEVDDALIGNGSKDEGEKGIKGIPVYLEELVNGEYVTAQVWQQDPDHPNTMYWTKARDLTDEYGNYSFKGFLPGQYRVRFEYGSNYGNVLSNVEDNEASQLVGMPGYGNENPEERKAGQNENSYNGQDYKSTIFQRKIDVTNNTITDYSNNAYDLENVVMEYNYETLDVANVSDAMDLLSRRTVVNNYSKIQTNHIAEVLASPYNVPKYPKLDENGNEVYDGNNNLVLESYTPNQMDALITELMEKTKMTAITPNITVDIEYNRPSTSGNDNIVNRNNNGHSISGNNGKNGTFILPSLDFGLVERPRAQLELEKEVQNVKVTLSDGTILFDNNQSAKNLVWQDNERWNVKNAETAAASETEKYGNEYNFRKEVRNSLPGSNKTGLIQIIIDNELMYGATIQIIYNVSVKNVGELDYVGMVDSNQYLFYAKGITRDSHNNLIVDRTTTSADEVLCYVPNNMQFDKNLILSESDNDKWGTVTVNDIYPSTPTDEEVIHQITGGGNGNSELNRQAELVNEGLKYVLNTYNTIISTDNLSGNLDPTTNKAKTINLVVSELMTKAAEDDLSYESIVEIVKTSNSVGRRMSYSVVGNQNPHEAPAEVDASKGETVHVLPPFGTSKVMYFALATAVAAILGIGIYLIKKKVVK